MKKAKGARWSWWSSTPPRDEIPPQIESLAVSSDSRGGTGRAVSEAVDAEGAKVVGPPRGIGHALTKSKSQGGQGARAAPRQSTGGATASFVEGRRSVSHVEANAAWVAASLGVRVIAADMPELMQVHAFRCARRSYDGLDKFSSKQMAHDIKKEFDKIYGPVWHCVIGSSFGSFVTHSGGCFLCFSMEKLLVMVFKTGIPRATA